MPGRATEGPASHRHRAAQLRARGRRDRSAPRHERDAIARWRSEVAAEKSEARKAFRAQSKLWAEGRADVDVQKLRGPVYERHRAKLQAVHRRLEELAEVALKREVGLERFMVVRVLRDDAYERGLQVLTLCLRDGFRGFRWAWELSGRVIRQNGTLGLKSETTFFDMGVVTRRKLDGTWERLRPKALHAS